MTPEAEDAAHAAATRVARESYGKLVAFLAARDRDIASAEDVLSDALAAALAEWPRRGVPANPEGWLIVTARRRKIDAMRRGRVADEASQTLRLVAEELQAAEDAGPLPDRRLALMFVCAHPAIDEAVRAPLMLQTILGLDAAAIASAFLVSPATMGQRLSRAKAKIRLAGAPFRIPEREELPERLDAVLEAIYAAFAYGWEQAFADDPRGRNLAEEAIWLGRLIAALAFDEPEALGLLALMLYADSRRAARRDDAGRYAPLAEQDVSRWNLAAIDEAELLLRTASAKTRPGRFQLEAAIQSAHAARRHGGATDWPAIAALYDALYALTGSKVVAVNRAVASAEAYGEARGLALLDAVAAEGALETYQSYWAARAALCARAGRKEEAADAYRHAIGLEFDPATRAFLIDRLAELG
ncbi:MAG: RNA polymerase subunit sigma-70 [Bradyrhizobium sp.]|nr:MAG: RNA polymerase subunit sigma-70 [Bradyrhizobium sp.]